MKQVEFTQLRAMLREVVATAGNDANDVKTIMAISNPRNGSIAHTSIAEVNSLLDVLGTARPSQDDRSVLLSENDLRRFEDLYYQRVTRLVFA